VIKKAVFEDSNVLEAQSEYIKDMIKKGLFYESSSS
jgi:hypothetical protein